MVVLDELKGAGELLGTSGIVKISEFARGGGWVAGSEM